MPALQNWPAIITALLDGEDLSVSDAAWSMEQVMTGSATNAQLAAFLIALRVKGETVDEIVVFRDAILDRFHDKLAVAEEAIDSGAAARKLDEWIAATKA